MMETPNHEQQDTGIREFQHDGPPTLNLQKVGTERNRVTHPVSMFPVAPLHPFEEGSSCQLLRVTPEELPERPQFLISTIATQTLGKIQKIDLP